MKYNNSFLYNSEPGESGTQKMQTKLDDDTDPEQTDGADNSEVINKEHLSESDPKEPTRGKMASVFILGFFMVVILCFVYAAWMQATITELKDIVVAVIGAMSGLVGFVIGYYFKSKN